MLDSFIIIIATSLVLPIVSQPFLSQTVMCHPFHCFYLCCFESFFLLLSRQSSLLTFVLQEETKTELTTLIRIWPSQTWEWLLGHHSILSHFARLNLLFLLCLYKCYSSSWKALIPQPLLSFEPSLLTHPTHHSRSISKNWKVEMNE